MLAELEELVEALVLAVEVDVRLGLDRCWDGGVTIMVASLPHECSIGRELLTSSRARDTSLMSIVVLPPSAAMVSYIARLALAVFD